MRIARRLPVLKKDGISATSPNRLDGAAVRLRFLSSLRGNRVQARRKAGMFAAKPTRERRTAMTPALWLQRAARLYPDAPARFRGRELVADYQAFARDAACIAGGLARTHGIC